MKKMIEQPSARTEIEVKATEQIFEINAAEQIFAAETGYALEPSCVVFGPLLRIGEHGVGFGNLLEALLGARLLVAVGVVQQGELAESVLDRLAVGVFRNAKNLVIVALGGCDDDSFIMNLLALKKRLNRGGRRGVQSLKQAIKNSSKVKIGACPFILEKAVNHRGTELKKREKSCAHHSPVW